MITNPGGTGLEQSPSDCGDGRGDSGLTPGGAGGRRAPGNPIRTSAAHTPGPWYAEFTGYNVDGDFDIETATVRDTYSLAIAEVEPHRSSVADVIANANLIAAAPDLLAAVKALLENVDEFGFAEISVEHPMATGVQLARAAIAKAEGRS